MRPALALVAALGLAAPFVPAASAQEQSVRIGLLDGVGSFTLSSATEAHIVNENGVAIGMVRPREAWSAQRQPSGRIVLEAGGSTLEAEGPVRILPVVSAGAVPLVYVGTKWYRGALEIRPGLTAINELPIEHYLYGVVPAEMPASWPIEALKAQSVAARTYAIAKLGDMASRGYDLKPTTDHQVYAGAAKERPETNYAIDATRAEVLTFEGRAIPAFYCSAAGGYTDGAETVWGSRPIPYLVPVPDFDQAAPSYLWQASLPAPTLRSRLAKLGVSVGDIQALEPLARGYSGRIRTLTVRGTKGTKTVSGERFRWATGLKSSLFNVVPVVERGSVTGFAFAGRGHGHGLGLSQWGARGMGQMGYNYIQILSHYYPNALLAHVGTHTASMR